MWQNNLSKIVKEEQKEGSIPEVPEGLMYSGLQLISKELDRVNCDINVIGGNMSKCSFKRAIFLRKDCKGVLFDSSDFSGADLSNSNFTNANFNDAILNRANLRESNFSNANMKGASFQRAILIDVNFSGAKLDGVDFEGASFSNCKTFEKLRNFRESNLKNNTWSNELYSYGYMFFYSKIACSQFTGAQLKQAKFCNAYLRELNFCMANLEGADFSGACLRGAIFMKANLSHANFTNADLTGANFEGAILHDVNFSGASFTNKTKIPEKLFFREIRNSDNVLVELNDEVHEVYSVNFIDAKLNRANMEYLTLGKALIHGADFTGTRIENSDFSEVNRDLKDARDVY